RTSVRMLSRSSVGFRRALISSEDNRRGASIWARPAMATCWNNMGVPPGCRNKDFLGYRLRPPGARPGTMERSCGRRSAAAAAPGRPALRAPDRVRQRVDGVGLEARGLVAGQGFQLLAHAQRVAVDE